MTLEPLELVVAAAVVEHPSRLNEGGMVLVVVVAVSGSVQPQMQLLVAMDYTWQREETKLVLVLASSVTFQTHEVDNLQRIEFLEDAIEEP